MLDTASYHFSSSRSDLLDFKETNVKKELQQSNEKKIEAMKKIICASANGQEVTHEVFTEVVKNMCTTQVELKKLVYLFLTKQGSQNLDLILLSINSFQRDLNHLDQFVRASALRAICSIKSDELNSIVISSLKTAANVSFFFLK